MRIILVGYMGSGKSSVGNALAQLLGLPFVDTDEWICSHVGASIASIFEERGEDAFRQLEQRCISEIADQYESVIIATGGGLPIYNDLMTTLLSLGQVVYLKVSVSEIMRRIGSSADRPLIAGRSAASVREHYGTRRHIYQRAPTRVWSRGEVFDIASRIISKLPHN